MFERFQSLLHTDRSRSLAYAASGFAALLAGRKVAALGLLGKALVGLEQSWRAANPDFDGSIDERWQRAIEHYEATHTNATNRRLHLVGIPFIVGGTAGLLLFPPYRPMWTASAVTFTGGWVANLVGHAFEGKAPAFAHDPLAFVAGAVWDFQQLLNARRARREAAEVVAEYPGHGERAQA